MLTTTPPLGRAALVICAAQSRRSRLLAASTAVVLGLGLLGHVPAGPAAAADSPELDEGLRVGHKMESIVVPGTALCPSPAEPCVDENRQVGVHLWYPADRNQPARRARTRYKSALHGADLPPPWLPLSWKIDAEIAREDAAVEPSGAAFPVIVFSHGSNNDPIDYAHTLELIAGAGFVVAAPSHVNNSQDDVRIDFINRTAGARFPCNDGRPSPCSRSDVPLSMADRVRDIAKVLDELPGWFGDRVDVDRAGVLGHSRGTTAALAAAGGTIPWQKTETGVVTCQASGELCWPLNPDHEDGLGRVRAVMGLAIAVKEYTRGINLENITVPTLLVSGALDRTSPPEVSQFAIESIASEEKAHISIADATHRTFNSTYCDQTQAAGAVADEEAGKKEDRIGNGDGDVDGAELADWQARAALDWHTVDGTVSRTRGSGKAMEYCSSATFTTPVNITSLVNSFGKPGEPVLLHPDAANAPTTGCDSDAVKDIVVERAVKFFSKGLEVGERNVSSRLECLD